MVAFKPGAGTAATKGLATFAFNLTSQDNGKDRFVSEFWFLTAANRDAFAEDPWTSPSRRRLFFRGGVASRSPWAGTRRATAASERGGSRRRTRRRGSRGPRTGWARRATPRTTRAS